jgi:hypothetical protein
MPFAYIIMLDRNGRPVDPSWGVDEGGHPGQGLPPGWGEHPGNRPPGSWSPPTHPGHLPARPGRPTDPGYGVEEGTGEAGQLPVWPVDPSHPIAPPQPGEPLPPVDPPPGTVWPPLPPGAPTGKALAMVWIQGVGMRYVVITIGSETDPDYGVDEGEPGGPEVQPPHPGQGLPGRPERPPVAGQPLPPQRPGMPPPQPGQPLPRPPVTPPAGGAGGRPPARPTPTR